MLSLNTTQFSAVLALSLLWSAALLADDCAQSPLELGCEENTGVIRLNSRG
jgi:hypothetical protein